MIEEMKVLEQHVQKLVEYVSQLKDANIQLESRVGEGEKTIQMLRQEAASLRDIEKDYQKLQQERTEVRGRVERLLSELKGVSDSGKRTGEPGQQTGK